MIEFPIMSLSDTIFVFNQTNQPKPDVIFFLFQVMKEACPHSTAVEKISRLQPSHRRPWPYSKVLIRRWAALERATATQIRPAALAYHRRRRSSGPRLARTLCFRAGFVQTPELPPAKEP